MASAVCSIPALRTIPASAGRRLLLLATDMGMGGGAEEQVIRLAIAFQTRGWETTIVSLLPPSPMPPDFAARGIPLLHLGMRRGIPSVAALSRLARVIRDFRPDVVHSHMVHANLLARAVRLLQPFPVLICTLHNLTMTGVDHDRSAVFEIAHRATDWLAERTTIISQAAADYHIRCRAVPARKMIVVPNGIDTQRYLPVPGRRERVRGELGLDGHFAWLAVGRLETQKAYHVLLRAFSRLADPSHRLIICGQGSRRSELEDLAKSLGIAASVLFLGLRADVHEIMGAADAFTLSSDYEGLPLVLLQAAAASLPIVATDVGGNAEVVLDGANGFLTLKGDIEAFAGAMSRLAAMPANERIAMGRAGRAHVQERFEAERIADRWEKLFENLLDGAAWPRRRASARKAAGAVAV